MLLSLTGGLLVGLAVVQRCFVVAEGETKLHEKGRCAIRGHCGKKSFFGGELPCADNGLAKEPEQKVRDKLVALCGRKWENGPVCCEDDQVSMILARLSQSILTDSKVPKIDALSSSLKLAQGIIASCPACKENFFNLFCTFTCSPDQSLFINVTEIEEVRGKLLVTELENVWSERYQSGFYNSCKDVKNGASGGKAMDFIGGGAKNYTQFLKFLGDKKLLGSPFQINFLTKPNGSIDQGMRALPETIKSCNDTDSAFRCSCIDCPAVCPELPALASENPCHIGYLPCFSFAVILTYSVGLLIFLSGILGQIACRKHRERKIERVRLLQDASPSDEEDEGDIIENAGCLTRPTRTYRLDSILDRVFNHLGRFCARFPAFTITTSLIVIGILSFGWLSFSVEQDPVKLWVSPTSAAAREKAFFDANFGPFYRAEQAFLVNDTHPNGPGSVLSYETLSWWFDVENRVKRMISLNKGLTLDNICFNPTGKACVIQSITGYFGGSFSNVDADNWQKQLRHCTESPGSSDCLPDFQQPLSPHMVLGGFEDSGDVLDARALIVTWVVNNGNPGTKVEANAIDWELSLQRVLQVVQEEAIERGLRVSFNAEISLEQELNKTTNTDARIVVISYLIMFIYASLALSSTTITWKSIFRNPANALVQSKFSLGIVGILIVLMSVSASVGLFAALGVKVTLIIAEVIPFLVLAVGVDNIFLIVHEFERVNLSHPDEELDQRIARALGRMGPSILLSASTETIAFSMGVFVGMPAVKNFAVYAAGAVLINALLQITMFISLLSLNQKRVESLRVDCFPCITVRKTTVGPIPGDQPFDHEEEGIIQLFIRKIYAPGLLTRKSRFLVLFVFSCLFAAGLALLPTLQLGLDQRIAIPSDSYLIQYFNDLYDYFGAGPPVYFVTRDVNVTARYHQQQLCGRFSTCDEYSLGFVLEQESKRPTVSYISGSAASWIDDFFYWLNPQKDCCVEDGKTCFEDRQPPWNISLIGMPEGQEFVRYANMWIQSPTTASCPLGGKAPYSNALVIDFKHVTTTATHFRASHTALRSQADFINAYASARRIANDISTRHSIDVFPYSKFYIFFDQYASIIRLTATLLGSAMAIIFILTALLLGSLATAAVVTLTVIMMVVDIMGTMAIVGVSLNAVSVVNLIICVGIGIEFCAHIARAFMFPSALLLDKAKGKFRQRTARAWVALVNVGGSVFSGITLTKLVGVCVLAFTRSKIFEIYYFRVWLALIIFAATHGLIFLPVALSFFGGEGYIDPESDGSLEEDLAARRYRSLLPDNDYDSDDY
ncbi:niemann-Pick type C- protein 1 [Ophidiomyces ophidiicola]|nr:niemann-Pick type C- protein 1 [Ophidiomyces ophidiicola]